MAYPDRWLCMFVGHRWRYFEDEANRPYTGYLERCSRCGAIMQIPQ